MNFFLTAARYLRDRLAEPTSKAAIGAVAVAAVAAATGQLAWSAVALAAVTNLVPVLVPDAARPVVAALGDALSKGAKKTAPVLLAGALALGISACSSDETAKVQAIGSDVVAGVEIACAAYAPVAAGLVESNDGVVRSLLVYGASVCDGGGHPIPGVALDDGTAVWVGQLAGMLKALASAKA